MEFEPIVSPLFVWVSVVGIFVLFVLQVLRIHRADFSARRKVFKQVLNGFFLFALLAFLLNPVWKNESNSAPTLLVSSDVTENEINFWKDSLDVTQTISLNDFEPNSDSLILLGKSFSKEFLYALRAKSVNWVIPNSGNEPSFLKWKGVLRQGEIQKIHLGLKIKLGSKVTISQSGNELYNYVIDSNRSNFEIRTSASILGRNEWEILIDKNSIGTIRFFVLPKSHLTFQVQAGFPGPELRTFSRYLSERGEKVQEVIQLSKNTALLTENLPLDSVDVFVIDANQIQDSRIQKQLDRGVAIFLLNLTDPEKQIKDLNKAFETDFQISSTNSTENRKLGNGLEAWTFEFKVGATQIISADNSIAIQQIGNSKIGVSLVTETFSLAQSGDSLGYAKFWDQVLADLRPEETRNWKVDAPLFQNEFFTLDFNGIDTNAISQLETEDLSISTSPINSNTSTLKGFAIDPAWQKLAEEIEGYAYSIEDWPLVFAQQERGRFLRSQSWLSSQSETNVIKKPIPFWLWGLVFGLLLTMIWLEPKIEI